MRARENPFRSDRVLEIRYRLTGSTWPQLLERLAQLQYRAALVGPEGTGKTTLLEDLVPRVIELGFRPRLLRLDCADSSFQPGFLIQLSRELGPREIIMLDGAEQLSRPGWHWFKFCTRRAGGLIVTSHRPGLLPTLFECATTPELLTAITTELLPPGVGAMDWESHQLFQRHGGNLRTALRELYDHYARMT